MNERIRKLAEQNFYYGVWEGDGVFTGQVDLEKFAELIVQEVFNVIENERFEIYEPVVEKVKEHFGVK